MKKTISFLAFTVSFVAGGNSTFTLSRTEKGPKLLDRYELSYMPICNKARASLNQMAEGRCNKAKKGYRVIYNHEVNRGEINSRTLLCTYKGEFYCEDRGPFQCNLYKYKKSFSTKWILNKSRGISRIHVGEFKNRKKAILVLNKLLQNRECVKGNIQY